MIVIYASYENCSETTVADVAEVIVKQTPPGITLQSTEEISWCR